MWFVARERLRLRIQEGIWHIRLLRHGIRTMEVSD